MLENYFERPETVDRVRGCWIGAEIERYVEWLAEHGYAARTVWHRVPILVRFGEFARDRGAVVVEQLPAHVDAFVERWASGRRRVRRGGLNGRRVGREVRGPIEQMLSLAVQGFSGRGRQHLRDPFADVAPGFFVYLSSERGLRPATLACYRHYLSRFQSYLDRVGVSDLGELWPPVLSAFMTERRAAGLAKTSIRENCGVLRVFLRYAHREGLIPRDLSESVEWPQVYRLSTIPRSISWSDVHKVLEGVDRRTVCGRRDYAILLLLITYGLRAREIVALTLDDIDWRRERLRIPERKAGHSTAFPLSPAVGEALIAYLRHGRPQHADRRVFFRMQAPYEPIGNAAVSSRARHYLLKAGVRTPRPGSHTLRHTCVQRLVDTGFPLSTIGDFIGHATPASTEIYAKIAVEALREVALGDGEEVL